MSDKKFRVYGSKTVTFEMEITASSKTAAIAKARKGEVNEQRIISCPNGFELSSPPRIEGI
ncbi:MAG: hypothetical protein OEY11_15350 [Gammaproteobacteria bacterium]|nr:hypothetical protein [Gammaproteobacteria bacterium]